MPGGKEIPRGLGDGSWKPREEGAGVFFLASLIAQAILMLDLLSVFPQVIQSLNFFFFKNNIKQYFICCTVFSLFTPELFIV